MRLLKVKLCTNMQFFDAHHLSVLQFFFVVSPLVVALLYYVFQLGCYMVGYPADPHYNPVPMRLWTGLAVFNAFLAAANNLHILELLWCVLFVTMIYMVNNQFGTNF